MRVPASAMHAPWARSSPARTRLLPLRSGRKKVTVRSVKSVSSNFTTRSAPSGMGAPVRILTAWPGASRAAAQLPAGTSSTISSVTGCAWDACAMSAAGGTASGARTAWDNTRP